MTVPVRQQWQRWMIKQTGHSVNSLHSTARGSFEWKTISYWLSIDWHLTGYWLLTIYWLSFDWLLTLYWLLTIDYWLLTIDYWLLTIDYLTGIWLTTDYWLSIDYWLLTIDYWLLTIDYWLLTIDYLTGIWLTTDYWLSMTIDSLLTIDYWLLTVDYWLLTIDYWLLTIWLVFDWHLTDYWLLTVVWERGSTSTSLRWALSRSHSSDLSFAMVDALPSSANARSKSNSILDCSPLPTTTNNYQTVTAEQTVTFQNRTNSHGRLA